MPTSCTRPQVREFTIYIPRANYLSRMALTQEVKHMSEQEVKSVTVQMLF